MPLPYIQFFLCNFPFLLSTFTNFPLILSWSNFWVQGRVVCFSSSDEKLLTIFCWSPAGIYSLQAQISFSSVTLVLFYDSDILHPLIIRSSTKSIFSCLERKTKTKFLFWSELWGVDKENPLYRSQPLVLTTKPTTLIPSRKTPFIWNRVAPLQVCYIIRASSSFLIQNKL